MDLFIDGVPFRVRHGESLSRQEILEVIMEELASRGLVLKEIVCHGEAMGEDGFLSIIDEVAVDFISCTESDITEEVMAEIGSSADLALSLLKDGAKDDQWLDHVQWICDALLELDLFIEDMDLRSISERMRDESEDLTVVCVLLEQLKGRFLREKGPSQSCRSEDVIDQEKGDEC